MIHQLLLVVFIIVTEISYVKEYGKSNVEEELLVTKMDRTQLINDLDTLKSCISAITDTFALPENELSDPTHQHQQKFPIQPKMYGTAEDMKRLKDWAVSVVKCGLYCRDKTVEVSTNYSTGTVEPLSSIAVGMDLLQ